ncbi:MAG: ATP-binding domain-containing protein [candidate division KSB1 bacterium]|nr:ATP-binding domain-containing protein [candidate division KSB1 bacterium]MDZ7311497.1 ATP-binding domain-containing protein [candidate division KSB1 bacterium]
MEVGAVKPDRYRIPIISFATIQAFKGMESPVVVLCDVDRIEGREPQSLLYVGMSRARSLLIVLLHEQTKPFVRQAVARKLEEGWSKSS